MPDIISLRGDGPWRGQTSRATSDRGERRQIKIQGGYVSSDGHEIRQFPGWHTLWDGTPENNSNGYERLAYDCVRPVISSPTFYYRYPFLSDDVSPGRPDGNVTQTLRCFAKAKYLHGFEQLRGRVIVFGESDHRRAPIYTSARAQVTISSVESRSGPNTTPITGYNGNLWRLILSGNPGAPTSTDGSGAGMQGLAVGMIVWVQDVTVQSGGAITQAQVDDHLNNRFFRVGQITTNNVDLITDNGLGTLAATTCTAGNVYTTRCNRSDAYATPGMTPFYGTEYDRIDDPLALTSWQITKGLDLDNPCQPCHPAWVANRQRDFSDNKHGSPIEGVRIPAVTTQWRGISRRQQAVLPYRLNPDVAGDRLILAAPGYPCVFQVPLFVPNAGEGFAVSPNETAGVPWWSNDLHDKPRSLGVPKGMMVDSSYTPPQMGVTGSSPSASYNFIPYVASGTGFPAGDYQLSISYRDDFTGEEGLASEPIKFTIPAPGAQYGIALTYMHPGYFMPECLALSLNVYLQPPGAATMGLYTSIPLMDSAYVDPSSVSAKYGFTAGTSPDNSIGKVIRTFLLPAPVNLSPLAACDFTRPAPQSRQMPRGAECYRVVRGIGFGIGHSGTHGNVSELRRSIFSSLYFVASPRRWELPDELQVRGFRSAAIVVSSTPTGPTANTFLDGGFGGGGKYLPPSYEGIQVWSQTLFPEPRKLMIFDVARNFRTNNTSGFDYDTAYIQRLKMAERVADPNIGDVGSPYAKEVYGDYGYLVLPRGQIQVSEPGLPEVTLAPAIQFLDASKDDDGLAMHQYGGGLIVCSKKETYHLSWFRAPTGQVPQLISREHGCIATNSMVEFDGGLVWISERGPVAIMATGMTFVGAELELDFRGSNRRYLTDSKGLMRHCFGVHDRSRGLVIWGLVSTDATHTVTWEQTTATFSASNDQAKSRFPCDELLIWSYRVGAWSTHRMPAGMEVQWMRELRDKNGDVRMCFMAADHRVYALDESWQDTNRTAFSSAPITNGSNATALKVVGAWAVDGNGGATARGTGENLLRTGMSVVFFDPNGNLVSETTISALDYANQQITLTDASNWYSNYTVEIGHRPKLTIQSTWIGETPDTIDLQGVHLRYRLIGSGAARAIVSIQATSLDDHDVQSTNAIDLGDAASPRIGRRRIASNIRAVGPEVQVSVEFAGAAHVAIADLLMENDAAGPAQ